MRLRRYDGALGEVVAFNCAAAWRDEAGLVGFYCFDAVGVGGGVSGCVG